MKEKRWKTLTHIQRCNDAAKNVNGSLQKNVLNIIKKKQPSGSESVAATDKYAINDKNTNCFDDVIVINAIVEQATAIANSYRPLSAQCIVDKYINVVIQFRSFHGI